MPQETFLQSLKSYVGFSDDSTAALREVHAIVRPHFAPIVDDFYAAIEAHPGARAAITGGAAQIARLKQTLVLWCEELFLGPHDEAYFERRARIGRMHVRINLPQAYMFTAMDRIRVQTLDVLRAALGHDLPALRRAATAANQIMDIELAIMLETYREDLMTKNRTAERLATIGQFAAGIGHELRNPMGVVESSVFLLRQNLSRLGVDDPKVTKHLDKISVEVKRSTKTITDLLELARNRPPVRRPVPATAMVTQALSAANLPAGVSVDVEIPADLTIWGDADQLGRVIINLVVNAAQAMNGQGRIVIDGAATAAETRLRVTDDGPGVPAEVRDRIFEALFTTKAKGSGLGLALCRRIADAHGGTVTLEPSARGAAFVLALPVPDQETR